MVKIDAKAVSSGDIEHLARAVLTDIEQFFADPEVQKDFEQWQKENKLEVAV